MKIKAFKSILMIMFVLVIMSMMTISAFAATEVSATGLTGNEQKVQSVVKSAYPQATKFNIGMADGDCKYPVTLTIDGAAVTVYLNYNPTPTSGDQAGDVGNIDVTVGDDGHLTVGGVGDGEAPWKTVIEKFRGVIAGITGVCTMIMIVLFILAFMKLGSSAGNPTQRTQALVGILWTGVATALLGSVTIWIGFFYNAL